MGREIRRVPPNWEHPRDNKQKYIPLYDIDFDTEIERWYEEYKLWQKWEHPDQLDRPDRTCTFWEWDGGPPRPETHRPVFTEEPTWYQIYETVSEGTPVSPPFATKEELIDYLVKYGDYWDQNRGDGGWDRKNAEQFVGDGWAPSMWICDGVLGMSRDGMPKSK